MTWWQTALIALAAAWYLVGAGCAYFLFEPTNTRRQKLGCAFMSALWPAVFFFLLPFVGYEEWKDAGRPKLW